MASVTIRNLDEETKLRLKVRAAQNNRSLEEELRISLRMIAEDETLLSPETENVAGEDVPFFAVNDDLSTNDFPYIPNKEIMFTEFIKIDPAVRFGRPCIKGTRISVYDVLGYLAAGMSITEITEDFPELSPAAIHACLHFAASRERRISMV
ncbi:MAG: DUF433 domain-containing protein [Balneolales bacterium]|nr:DUF433 domain-containing protein [Balneolales bacterium]